MSDMTGEACACLTVQFKPKEHDDGSWTGRWLCSDCGREFRPATPLEPSAESARHLQLLATMETMRRLGVTRYRAGDVEIELRAGADGCYRLAGAGSQANVPADGEAWPGEPWPGAFEQFGRAVREAGYPQRVPSGSPEPDDAPPNPAPDPPDEQPAVEIDFAATEELLRAQDARRRGQGA